MRNSERWIAGALLTIALLAFFFPLASLQLPVVGNIDVSGYDYLSKSKQFEDRVENLKSQFPPRLTSEIPNGFADDGQTVSLQPLPFSVETLPFLKVEIFGSFSLVALALLFSLLDAPAAKAISTIAGVVAITAILHMVIADSDLHSWFQAQMMAGATGLQDNPFVGLAQGVANLVSKAIHLKPGPGLYALAAASSLGALTLHLGTGGRANSPAQLEAYSSIANEDHSPAQLNVDSSTAHDDQVARFFAFAAIGASAIGVAIMVLTHGPHTSHSERSAHRSHASGSALTSPNRRPHTYFNQRFGFSVSYPQTFRAGRLPENGDGCEFESPRADARLNAFGSNNDGNGIVAEYNDAIQDVRGVLGYHKLGGNWFVVTWNDGSNINYQKTFVGRRSINTFVFSYPQDRKDEFDPMVTAIEKSFHPGNLEQAW